MSNERRSEPRWMVRVPVEYVGEAGLTRDISASGVYFFTSTPPAPGTTLRFTLVFRRSDPEPTRVGCSGSVVRVDQHQEQFGVAVAIEAFGT